MELVIDVNILMSALIALEGKSSKLIFLKENKLYAPEFLREEIKKHNEEIKRKSKLSSENFEMALMQLSEKLEFIPFEEYSFFLETAAKISPDPDDVAYFAVCLLKKCPLWSNDKLLKSQSEVKVLSTSELVQLFS